MKKLMMTVIAAFSMQAVAAAPADKTLLYCDYMTETQNIFMDLYFDHNAELDAYVNAEVGFLNEQGLEYPEYLWTVAAVDAADKSTSAFTVTKDADTITYTLPILAKDVNGTSVSGVTLTKDANGAIAPFDLPFTGTYAGAEVNGVFQCYVPQTSSQTPR